MAIVDKYGMQTQCNDKYYAIKTQHNSKIYPLSEDPRIHTLARGYSLGSVCVWRESATVS